MTTTRRLLGLATVFLIALPTSALADTPTPIDRSDQTVTVEAPACSVDSIRLRVSSAKSMVLLSFKPEVCLCDANPSNVTQWLTEVIGRAINSGVQPDQDPIEYVRSELEVAPGVVLSIGANPEPEDVTLYCYTEQMIRDYWVEFHESANVAEVIAD